MSLIAFSHLLVRPCIRFGEAHNGYKLRLAHANGLPSPGWLDNCAGLALPDKPDASHTRWCPLCLDQEAPNWLEQWSGPMPICPIHQCWLADTCECCDRRLNWRNARFLSCSCGGSLVTITPTPLSAELMRLISPSDQHSSWWAHLNVEHRWRAARLLGALHTFGLNNKPLKKASANAIQHLRILIGTGAAIMLGGEIAFHDLLRRIRTTPSSATSVQLMRDAFPALLIKIRRQLPHSTQEVIYGWVRTYLQKQSNNAGAISWKASRVTLSATECAKRLHIRPERVLEMLSENGVAPPARVTSTGRTMLAVAPSVIEAIQNKSARKLSQAAASKIYGLSVARLTCLIKTGLINGDARKVDRESIADLLRGAVQTPEKEQLGNNLTALDSLLRTAVPLPHTGAFFTALLSGKISSAGTPNHAREILVCRLDTKAALAECSAPVNELVSIPQAAERLKLKQEVLYHLVDRGLIKVISARVGRRAARFVTEAEIARFNAQIEPLSVAASRCGISKQSALRWALSCKLEIISGPSIDGGRQYFLRKSHAPISP